MGGRRLDLGLGEGPFGGDRADEAAGRFVEQGLERIVLVVDGAAQLALSGVEFFTPPCSRGVKDRGGVFRAIPITALSRSLDPVSLSSRTWPRTTTVSCRRSVASPSARPDCRRARRWSRRAARRRFGAARSANSTGR